MVHGSRYDIARIFGKEQIAPHLENARAVCVGERQNASKVQIVCEYNIMICSGPSDYFDIRRIRAADFLPVNRFMSMAFEIWNPLRRQVHVDQDFQAVCLAKGASLSSTRHIAYSSASLISSDSRYGYALRILSSEWPAESRPRIVPTVTLIPLMQGFPPITSGSNEIRLSFPISFGLLCPLFFSIPPSSLSEAAIFVKKFLTYRNFMVYAHH
jgi:hypothetical protein